MVSMIYSGCCVVHFFQGICRDHFLFRQLVLRNPQPQKLTEFFYKGTGVYGFSAQEPDPRGNTGFFYGNRFSPVFLVRNRCTREFFCAGSPREPTTTKPTHFKCYCTCCSCYNGKTPQEKNDVARTLDQYIARALMPAVDAVSYVFVLTKK